MQLWERLLHARQNQLHRWAETLVLHIIHTRRKPASAGESARSAPVLCWSVWVRSNFSRFSSSARWVWAPTAVPGILRFSCKRETWFPFSCVVPCNTETAETLCRGKHEHLFRINSRALGHAQHNVDSQEVCCVTLFLNSWHLWVAFFLAAHPHNRFGRIYKKALRCSFKYTRVYIMCLCRVLHCRHQWVYPVSQYMCRTFQMRQCPGHVWVSLPARIQV